MVHRPHRGGHDDERAADDDQLHRPFVSDQPGPYRVEDRLQEQEERRLEGLQVEGSAESVGERTTSSVVQAISLVIILDAAAAIWFMEMGY